MSPPKAKLDEIATSIGASREAFATQSMSHSGSGSLKPMVGGRKPSRSASTVVTRSSAPEAFMVWPYCDFDEETGSRSRWPPNTWRSAAVSVLSLSAVAVPWALT